MTGRYVLSPAAQDDLDDIWNFSAQRWGVEQADIYVRQIWRDVEVVATRPGIGRSISDVRAGYYRFPSGSHLLFYRLNDGVLDIVRILHKRMDFARHI